MNVHEAMSKMNASRGISNTDKGAFGEEAVLAVVQEYKAIRGGLIVHSFMYPYARNGNKNYPGNIKQENGTFITIDGTTSTHDEIDILYVTSNRIFAIEAKARSGKWELFDYWTKQQGVSQDKSPIAQAEKHARHLYHQIWEFIPDGNPDYIIPLTVFVDKASIHDSRCDRHMKLLPVAILNTLKNKLIEYDTPLDYAIDIKSLTKQLNKISKGTFF